MPLTSRGSLPGILERWRAILARGEFRPAVLTLVGGTTFGRIAIVATSPIITRLFAPAELGEFAAVLAIVGILIILGDLSYSAAILLPEDDAEAFHILVLCFLTIAITGSILGVILWLEGPTLLGLFGAAAASGYAVLIVSAQVLGNAVVAFASWGTRMRHFRRMALSDSLQSVATAGAQIAFGLAAVGAAGLLAGWVVGAVVGLALLAFGAFRGTNASFRRVEPARVLAMARRYRRFAFLTTPSAFLNSLGLRAPLLVLVLVYGPEVGGQYALAERVAFLPVTLAAAAVGQVYQAHAAPLARRSDDSLRSLYLRTTRSLAVYALPVTVTIAILSPLLFGIIFGADWVEAGVFAAVLTPWFYAQLVTNPTGRTLDLLERQDVHFRREVLRMAIIGSAAGAIILARPAPIGAVVIFSIAGCVTYAMYGFATWRAITSHRPRASASGTGVGDTPEHPGPER